MFKNKQAIVITKLWSFALLFFLFRSIFNPLKYFAFFSFILIIIYCSIYVFKQRKKISLIPLLNSTKEPIIIATIILWGVLLSNELIISPLKELINFFGIFFIAVIYIYIKKYILFEKILKLWLYFSLSIGIFSFLLWVNNFFLININVFNYLNQFKIESNSISLTSDYNFFSLIYIISITILLYGIYKNILKQNIVYTHLMLWVFILNILLAGSRRGFFALVILTVIGTVYALIKINKLKKNILFYKNIFYIYITLFLIFTILMVAIPFRTSLIKEKKTRDKITLSFYKYATISNTSLSYSTFKEKLWPKYWNNLQDATVPENLLYNGDFSLENAFWDKILPVTDTVSHILIKTEFGNALRVERKNGTGWYPLAYNGRNIIYYKDVNYTFKFKFRVIKGIDIPFNIGWWIKDKEGFLSNLPKEIRKINSDWFECSCSYTFKNTHQGHFATFMSSQKANTIIDFTDIQLVSNDTLNRPKYLDQIQTSEVNDSINYLSDNRTERWQYAFELFKNYTLKEKIIGNGFNYIYLFDQKFFHPKLTIEEIKSKDYFDYPHNPILSAFLYSGIIGGLFNIYFVLLTIWYYWKSRRTLGLFLILYGITLFFVFFSGNTFFSVPIFIVLSMIPFIERYRIKTSS